MRWKMGCDYRRDNVKIMNLKKRKYLHVVQTQNPPHVDAESFPEHAALR